MLYLVALLAAMSAALLVVFVGQVSPSRPVGLTRQLDELRRASGVLGRDNVMKERGEQLTLLLQSLGERMGGKRRDEGTVRLWLIQAGFLNVNAVAVYWGARLAAVLALAGAALLIVPLFRPEILAVVVAALWMGAVGWILPPFYVRSRLKRRQKEVQRALPDALDMLVVCVEAGLGLNQALVRVADEIYHVSPLLGEQIIMVNLEIRAGTPREDALRLLAQRTGPAPT